MQALQPLVPDEAEGVIIGDGDFHCVSLLKAVQAAGWTYCVRLHADTYVRHTPGPSRPVGVARLVYHWARGEERPWRLVTNAKTGDEPVVSAHRVLQHDRRRMWIEELFGGR